MAYSKEQLEEIKKILRDSEHEPDYEYVKSDISGDGETVLTRKLSDLREIIRLHEGKMVDYKNLDEALDFACDFLESKGIKGYVGSSKPSHELGYIVEFRLPIVPSETFDLWMEFIDLLIEKELDQKYPLIAFMTNKYWLDEFNKNKNMGES